MRRQLSFWSLLTIMYMVVKQESVDASCMTKGQEIH